MKTNDILIAYVSWPGGGKSRPIYVIEDKDEKIIFFKITTKYKGKSVNIRKKYFPIKDWKEAGLFQPSYIDTITVAYLDKNKIKIKYIGKLTPNDIHRLRLFMDSQES